MSQFDVLCIGNAIVDIIARCEDDFLVANGIHKGAMNLIDAERAEALYAAMGPAVEMSGGSAGNTAAGIASLGGSAAYFGKVSNDSLGRIFAHDIRAQGVAFDTRPLTGNPPTARSMIFVTPDGERSMNTYLGISAELNGDDVNPAVFSGAGWLFLEGYLFDKDAGKAAFLKAAEACHAAGGQAGIALSDPFCVDRHRTDFRRLVAGPMDYVIGNVHEWKSLYQVEDLDEALRLAAADCGTVVCTCSGDDAILIRGDERVTAPVHRVVPVDATGAGDQFAAGLIYGLAVGAPLAAAGRMGCIAAAEVISHVGARPEGDLRAAFRAEGLI